MTKGISQSAKAEIYISRQEMYCFLCKKPIEKNSLAIQGTSRCPQYGYIGGFFHKECFLTYNDHPLMKARIAVAENEYEKLGIPNVKPFGSLGISTQDWDFTLTDLLNKQIIILSFEDFETQKGKSYLAECVVDGQKARVLVGGMVTMKQLKAAEAFLPIEVTTRKIKTYYQFE